MAKDGEVLVFVKVRARSGAESGFPSERRDAAERTERELVALAYLAERDAVDVPVRFDDIGMVAIASDRAMIRHHINSMCAEILEDALPEAA